MKYTLKVRAVELNTPEKCMAFLSRCRNYGIDEILIYIGRAPVYCKSSLAGSAIEGKFDALGYLLDNAGAISVYAWWGVGKIPNTWAAGLKQQYSDWDTATLKGFPADFHFMDWRRSTVAPFITSFIQELFINYPKLTGVTLDTFWFGVWPGANKGARVLYGNSAPDYLKVALKAARIGCENKRLGVHVFPDYYGYYLCQCWNAWLDDDIPDFLITGAYYNTDKTYGDGIKGTWEWAIASWEEKYRPRIIPCLSAIDTIDGEETLKTVEAFKAQYDLCAEFARVGIFDNRLTDDHLLAISPEPMVNIEVLTHVKLIWQSANVEHVYINDVETLPGGEVDTWVTTPRKFTIVGSGNGREATKSIEIE